MKLSILIKITVLILLFFSNLSAVMAWHSKLNEAEKVYFRQVFTGDLSNIGQDIKGLEGAELVMDKYTTKFIDKQHGIELDEIEEPLIRDIMKLYLNYWREALLAPGELTAFEAQMDVQLVKLANEHMQGTFTDNNVMQAISDYINSKGYGVLFGRTAPFYEFMLWRKNEDHIYRVELSNSVQDVKVTDIGDFISSGWSNYATHGAASTGGWATKKQLYCVCDTYDKASEKFLISYLKHEGRHFADFNKYPKLQSASLEYRAKLSELSFADKTSVNLLNSFTYGAVKNSLIGHALANWHISNNMRQALTLKADKNNQIDWQSVTVKQIQTAARQLLRQNDQLMIELGAENTENSIFPVEN